jgi:hypothetical protein
MPLQNNWIMLKDKKMRLKEAVNGNQW